ncbi:putative dual specificity phosphatase, catalytic domain [Lyophyllum shimeji]|uniref:protein-tyrosine-phosphatase n=1 Tax=Lyophyllum shimeji TaxID=47721 RepID=A0A9P3PFB8_LYOSH|nr:putative dual specificity phosphatase, catalytic domain [Lyophyllum shimeji]
MAFNVASPGPVAAPAPMSYNTRSPWASPSPSPALQTPSPKRSPRTPASPARSSPALKSPTAANASPVPSPPTTTTKPAPKPTPKQSIRSRSPSTTRPSISTKVSPTNYPARPRTPSPGPGPGPGAGPSPGADLKRPAPAPATHQHTRLAGIGAPRGASEIVPRVFISDLSFAENPACLGSHRITHIVSALSHSVVLPSPSALPDGHPAPRHLHVRVEDFPFAELAAHLPGTVGWIEEALREDKEARVLVHCGEGVSRSVAVVAAYLIKEYGWSPEEAVEFIKSKRGVADPNQGFVQQLGEYARSLGR